MSDDLKSQISILRVVGDHVRLKKQSGIRWVGLCPFHKEDTPSFTCFTDSNRYQCFGCGKKGDVYEFLQEINGIDFLAAKQILADMIGVDPDAYKPPPRPDGVPRPIRLTDKPQETACYQYTDEKGNVLYEIVRKEYLKQGVKKKDFLQRYTDESGTVVWEEYKKRPVLYRLHLVAPADTVWIVEGEKDVHTLESWGAVATSPPGGSKKKWQKSFTKTLKSKKCYIIPDNDDPGRDHAQKVYDALFRHADVVVVRIPGPLKSDVTDWKEAGGSYEELLELARAADEKAEQERRNEFVGPRREPNEVAKEILEKKDFLADENGLLFEYNGRFWEKATNTRLRHYAHLADGEAHTNQRRRGEIADFIETYVQVPRIRWRQLASTEIPLLNGVFDVRTLALRKHRKEDYLETVVPVAYKEQADCPTWRRALKDYFGTDLDAKDKMLALQQFFGYLLLPHAKFKKALILFGESNTGKSEPLKIMEAMVGSDNTCSVGVEKMDDPRYRVPIVGKLLNKLSELSDDAVIADGGFKTLISTEESLLFDPKFVAPFMYVPIAKHVFVTNRLPTVNDLTAATFNRLLIIRFNYVIPKEKQDRELTAKLIAEMPGILNWAICGALDLIDNSGQFVEVGESEALVSEYRRQENEINQFLEEVCDQVEDSYIWACDLREKYWSWCGRRTKAQSVGRMMAAAGFPGVPRAGDRSRRHYGLRWKSGEEPSLKDWQRSLRFNEHQDKSSEDPSGETWIS
ncbi:MAG: phage/plasmid primase, P4 family [Paludibaculum sp.]